MIYCIKTPLYCNEAIVLNDKFLISSYSFDIYKHKNVHSVGAELSFYNPCIVYVKKGYVKFLYKGLTLYAHEGDLVYITHGTKYQSIWYGSPEIHWYAINFKFKSDYNFHEYEFQILEDYPVELFDKICETYQNSYFLSASYLYQLLDDVYKKLKTSKNTAVPATIKPAIEYIEKNYNQDFSINTLAGLCNYSESGFFKLFKKTTGITPIAYKHNVMIQHAIDLLGRTNLSIEEISSRTGFSSSNYFRTVFFKLTGKKPKELR